MCAGSPVYRFRTLPALQSSSFWYSNIWLIADESKGADTQLHNPNTSLHLSFFDLNFNNYRKSSISSLFKLAVPRKGPNPTHIPHRTRVDKGALPKIEDPCNIATMWYHQYTQHLLIHCRIPFHHFLSISLTWNFPKSMSTSTSRNYQKRLTLKACPIMSPLLVIPTFTESCKNCIQIQM